MRITYYGHACFALEEGKFTVLIDPWFKGNPVVSDVPEGLRPDLILVTHGHHDHLGDAVEIGGESGATIISTPEVCHYCAKQGAKTEPVHYGGTLTFDSVSVSVVPAWHSSSRGRWGPAFAAPTRRSSSTPSSAPTCRSRSPRAVTCRARKRPTSAAKSKTWDMSAMARKS